MSFETPRANARRFLVSIVSSSMSTVLSPSDVGARALFLSRVRLPDWIREPLLHFVILGGVLFGVDSLIVARSDDPNSIVIGEDVDNEARQVFETSRGRAPNAEELQALRQVWLDNEVLYR